MSLPIKQLTGEDKSCTEEIIMNISEFDLEIDSLTEFIEKPQKWEDFFFKLFERWVQSRRLGSR